MSELEQMPTPQNIDDATEVIKETIESKTKMNRAQRRKIMKRAGKTGKQARHEMDALSETVRRVSYIDLIEKFRKLNEENSKHENANEDDRSLQD